MGKELALALLVFVFVFIGEGAESGSGTWIVSGTGGRGLFLNLCLFFGVGGI